MPRSDLLNWRRTPQPRPPHLCFSSCCFTRMVSGGVRSWFCMAPGGLSPAVAPRKTLGEARQEPCACTGDGLEHCISTLGMEERQHAWRRLGAAPTRLTLLADLCTGWWPPAHHGAGFTALSRLPGWSAFNKRPGMARAAAAPGGATLGSAASLPQPACPRSSCTRRMALGPPPSLFTLGMMLRQGLGRRRGTAGAHSA